MFDMEQIGIKLMKCRKAAGLTQMELADRMGISFQAVSNWERGLSCPDISKLSELSDLFGVTVDELLGNKRAAEIVTAIEKEDVPVVSAKEFEEIAPLLSRKQAERTAETVSFDMEDVKCAAPFLSEAFINRVVVETYRKTKDLNTVCDLFAFMSQNDTDALASEILAQTETLDDIQPLFPFMSEEYVGNLAVSKYERTQDLQVIAPCLPFMSQESLKRLANDVYGQTHSIDSLQPLFAFLNSAFLEELIMKKYANE